ncbi:Methyltransferase domain-containing protein [Roseovarius lutimaris]|uniref:Methyltransferase domain-containing protein n=1 Tax=Roseovarius lutimaris TaxID=1005928 RepID=A0A1I5FRG1_9RHOB|nr:DUF4942 domain-containing protein [Roseovarius lutimaris]SFO26398.1 Methyltransferase domain-containing protein [Roseovarius lutimaris]
MNMQAPEIMADDSEQASSLPAVTSQIEDIVAARDAALAKITEAAATLEAAYTLTDEANAFARKAQCGRKYWGIDRTHNKHYEHLSQQGFDAAQSVETYRRQLDASVWSYLLEETGIRDLMDATGSREFDQGLREEVPPVTVQDVRATFETWMCNADLTFARGLAVAFARLDSRFKSHDAFKLGSRMIVDRAFSEYSGSFNRSWAEETIIDVERVFAKLDEQAPAGRGLIQEIDADRRGYGPQQSLTESRFFRIRGFMNGNAHLWFTRDDLVTKANQVLADYYGEVIPDAAPKDEDSAAFTKRTNLPSKDLQFYHTPAKAAAKVVDHLRYQEGQHILEPSAGTGHLVRPLLEKGHKVTAIEIHADRVRQLREHEGPQCSVIHGNFLNQPANPIYDAVIQNPPFFRTHWMDHLRHAYDFLKFGGQLIAIVPASAEVGQSKAHIQFRRWAEKANGGRSWGMFTDLPTESFAEAGTNINTVIFKVTKQN